MIKLGVTLLTTALIVALLYSPSPTASAAIPQKACECSSESCSTSITCTGGCQSICGGENCTSFCSGGLAPLAVETTFQAHNVRYPQLITELAHISGKELVFSPDKPDVIFNTESKQAILWDVLDMLSQRGKVEIAGQDFDRLKRLRRILLSGERFSVSVHDTSVSTFVNDLTGLTGLSFRIVQGRPLATMNVNLHNLTLTEILDKVYEQTSVRIIEEGIDASTETKIDDHLFEGAK
jgi:hypothetical protein